MTSFIDLGLYSKNAVTIRHVLHCVNGVRNQTHDNLPQLDQIGRDPWEIIGQFMYPAGAYRSLLGLVRAELLDLKPIRALQFPLEALSAAMDAAANATNLECVVVEP